MDAHLKQERCSYINVQKQYNIIIVHDVSASATNCSVDFFQEVCLSADESKKKSLQKKMFTLLLLLYSIHQMFRCITNWPQLLLRLCFVIERGEATVSQIYTRVIHRFHLKYKNSLVVNHTNSI